MTVIVPLTLGLARQEQNMAYQSLNPLPYHDESSALVSASPDRVFALIDDHERLA